MSWVHYAFLAIIPGILLFSYYFSDQQVVRRRLKKLRFANIEDLKVGQVVKLTGSAEVLSETLEAPLSGRECLYYKTNVTENKKNGSTLIDEQKGKNFLLDQNGQKIEITTQNVRSFLISDGKYRSGWMDEPTERMTIYLKKHGHDAKNFLGITKSIKCKEGVIEIGEMIAVAGRVEYSSTENENGEKLLRLTVNGKKPLYLTDDPESF